MKNIKEDTKVPVWSEQTEMEYEIVRVGWHDENLDANVVLLSKKAREQINIAVGRPVKIKKGKKCCVGVVMPQFQEHCKQPDVCTLNTTVAKCLDSRPGQKVIIDRALTESEYQSFLEKRKKWLNQAILNIMRSISDDENQED